MPHNRPISFPLLIYLLAQKAAPNPVCDRNPVPPWIAFNVNAVQGSSTASNALHNQTCHPSGEPRPKNPRIWAKPWEHAWIQQLPHGEPDGTGLEVSKVSIISIISIISKVSLISLVSMISMSKSSQGFKFIVYLHYWCWLLMFIVQVHSPG